MVGKVGGSQILVNLLVTSVPRCYGNSAKTAGLKHLQFPDMGASGGYPDGACVVHHGTDELNSIHDGQTTSSVQEIW